MTIKIPKFKPVLMEGGLKTIERKLAEQGEKLKPFRYDGPVGEKGKWKIEPFEVVAGLGQLRLVRDGGRGMAPGTYHRLLRDKHTVVMSDTDAELIDFLQDMKGTRGNVLVGGLGMGIAVKAMLLTGKIKKITIVELDREIISLVGDWVTEMCIKANVRISIEQGNVLKWKPPANERWDYAWFDIWDTISDGNIADMQKLRYRYGQLCKVIKQWCEKQCMLMDHGISARHWAYHL